MLQWVEINNQYSSDKIILRKGTYRSLIAYIWESIRDRDVEFWHVFLFKSSTCATKIWDRYLEQFGYYVLFGNVAISVIFISFIIITFGWNGNFELWWFHRKELVDIYKNIPYFKSEKYFLNYKINFWLKY